MLLLNSNSAEIRHDEYGIREKSEVSRPSLVAGRTNASLSGAIRLLFVCQTSLHSRLAKRISGRVSNGDQHISG